MQESGYDKEVSKTVDGVTIDYGIIFGNENIVFIKAGSDGDILGFGGKYPQMAHRVHDRLAATVICASNPSDLWSGQLAADKGAIAAVAKKCNHTDYTLALFGSSDGGHHIIKLAAKMPQAKRVVGVNASCVNFDELCKRLQKIPNVEKTLIYGDRDECYNCATQLAMMDIPHLEIITVPGADHEFNGMVDEFISFIDLI